MSSRRPPGTVAGSAPASLPPPGLPGLDPSFSRLVRASSSEDGTHEWHLLDNGAHLGRLGAEPVGTVLCVHGNPTWSYLWRTLLGAATQQAAAGGDAWRVVAVDQLEMGFSERTGRHRTLRRRVRDLSALTESLGLDGPVVTLGHDWGGVVSLGWAVDHADQLAGTILLNTAVHQPEGSPVPAPLRLALQSAVLRPGTVLTPAFLETTLRLARPALAPEVSRAYRAPYRTAARREGIGGFVADIPVDESHPSAPELDRIAEGVRLLDRPALLLWGARDPVFSDRYLHDLLGRLPQADVHRFPDAGHLVAEDVDHADAVLGWLADRRGDLISPFSPTPRDAALPGDDAPHRPLWAELLDGPGPGDDTALVEMAPPRGPAPRVVSRRLLARRVRELTAGLARSGVRPGDRVSLLVPPGADLTVVLYACLRLGAVVVVADAGLGVGGLTRAVRSARPDHVIGALPGLTLARALGWPGRRISTVPLPRALASTLGVVHSLADLIALGADAGAGAGAGDRGMPPAPAPSDLAAVLFTSGSTGPAKGVVYTHAQLSAVRDVLAAQYGVGPGTGLVAGFAPFALLGPALGARTVTPDMDVTSPRTLTARAVAAAVAAVDATVVFLSPAALANVVATAGDLDEADRTALAGVRHVLSADAPVPSRLLAEAERLMPGAVAHTPYGMTEALLLTDITLDGIRAADGTPDDGLGGVCVGRPVAVAQVRIDPLDGKGHPLGAPASVPGITGEIVVSAAHVKDHYDLLHLTERAGRRSTGAGRWHRTGDVGHLDGEGRLWVEGRVAHVIVTADGVVTPVGLEQRIEMVPGVRRAAVVGVGPRGTEQVVAVVETQPAVRRPGLAGGALAEAVRRAVGPRTVVAAVLAVPDVPTDVRHNSKVDRSRLGDWAAGVLAGGRIGRP